MQVKMQTLMAGPDGVFEAGKVADLPEEQALELVANGYAVLMEKPAKSIQTAVEDRSVIETAARPRRAKR
jgi:hypothetical protein